MQAMENIVHERNEVQIERDSLQLELEREKRDKKTEKSEKEELRRLAERERLEKERERREKEIITQQRDEERREKERLLGLFHLTFSFHFCNRTNTITTTNIISVFTDRDAQGPTSNNKDQHGGTQHPHRLQKGGRERYSHDALENRHHEKSTLRPCCDIIFADEIDTL